MGQKTKRAASTMGVSITYQDMCAGAWELMVRSCALRISPMEVIRRSNDEMTRHVLHLLATAPPGAQAIEPVATADAPTREDRY